MSSKDLRRLDLRLPPTHPIFDFDVEPRQRAKIAREWLDTGARIAVLESRIPNIEKQLADIKEMLIKGNFEVAQKVEPTAAQGGVDVAAFAKVICDLG